MSLNRTAKRLLQNLTSPDKPGLQQGLKLEEQVTKSRWARVQEWDYRLFTYVALAHEEKVGISTDESLLS